MKHIETILCAFALLLSFSASAQNMKPVKDKATKKYGYQTKGKVWVIEPQFDAAAKFDKNGMAEVKVNGRTGIIDGQGTFIIPAEYDNISKFDKYGYCELMQKEGSVKYRGIADLTGRIVLRWSSVTLPSLATDVSSSARRTPPSPASAMRGSGVFTMPQGKRYSPRSSISVPLSTTVMPSPRTV